MLLEMEPRVSCMLGKLSTEDFDLGAALDTKIQLVLRP